MIRWQSLVVHRVTGSAVALLAVVIVGATAGCGSTDAPELSSLGERGRQVSIEVGCAGCHGGGGEQASIGPSWAGAWGSVVELDDGSTVRFDAAYVERSIRKPGDQRRSGDWMQMPAYAEDQLTDDEIAAIAAYIEELG